MTLKDAIKLVEGAKIPVNLFGKDHPAQRYHELAKLLHPDKTKGDRRAASAFVKLGDLYSKLNGKTVTAASQVFGSWAVGSQIAHGDIADIFECGSVTAASAKHDLVFKLARSEDDNDLLENEYAHLGMLYADRRSDNFKRYIPRVVDQMILDDRRANILTKGQEVMTLSDILDLYPKGLPFRHVVWMGNRLFSALWFAHQNGIVHGAVLPEHLMFGPETHGLQLVDWCYSITGESKKHIPALVGRHEELYPVEVKRKTPPTPATDIFMAAATLSSAAEQIPRRFRGLFEWCKAPSPNARPQDAWKLREKWLSLAEEEFGPPAYLKLEIPIV